MSTNYGEGVLVKILNYVEGVRQAKGLTRKQLAEKMGSRWSKESLDKLFDSPSCPRADTIAEILRALDLPTYPPEWFRSKKTGEIE